MNELKIFNFEEQEVRTQLIDDELWFVGKDVAEVLGYERPDNAIRNHIDEEDKLMHQISASGQMRNMTIINESGMYALVFGSKLDKAKRFKRWVTSEVLPTIRKTGKYQSPMSQEDIMIATLENQKEIKKRLNTVSDDVEELKLEIDLSRRQKAELSRLVRKNAMNAVGGKKSNAYKELYRVAIAEHWRALKNAFEVASYEEIPKLKFEEAMQMAEMWLPSMELAYKIKQLNTQIEMEV
ncbi:BRO family protein [Pisciglobus halotolerans]|uniref:Prophage antirepressor n=1 Tax=Pisciglobus halotolerans TaxID=745365 RepID=A0A1I3BJ23_9LACT|nr:BRO family protein [Pisciglobus halotolerans]SFH62278.1 Prophage antirepressor [Pisciglobus halotolerans]